MSNSAPDEFLTYVVAGCGIKEVDTLVKDRLSCRLVSVDIVTATWKPDKVHYKRATHCEHIPHDETIGHRFHPAIETNATKFQDQKLEQPDDENVQEINADKPFEH